MANVQYIEIVLSKILFSMNTKILGKAGEKLAVKYLKKHKYNVLQCNYSCKQGEIDIVAQDGIYTVFVEVKTRLTDSYGLPRESVTATKRHHIISTANMYILEKKVARCQPRFDVIEVYGDGNIVHIIDAFRP